MWNFDVDNTDINYRLMIYVKNKRIKILLILRQNSCANDTHHHLFQVSRELILLF